MSVSKVRAKFTESVGNGHPLLVIRSDEFSDVESDLSDVCRGSDYLWEFWVWDCDGGLVTADGPVQAAKPSGPPGVPAALASQPPRPGGAVGLAAAVKTLLAHCNRNPEDPASTVPVILTVRNLHRFWRGDSADATMVIQVLQNFFKVGKATSKFLVGLTTPGELPPPELLPLCNLVDHKIPTVDEFPLILDTVDMEGSTIPLGEADRRLIAEASCGLTRLQAETAYGTAMQRYAVLLEEGKTTPAGPFFQEVIEEFKGDVLNTDGTLKRWHLEVPVDASRVDGPTRLWPTWDDVGGYQPVKDYLVRVTAAEARRKRSKLNCILLVGAPGTGKTLIAKALGNYTHRKTYGANLSSQKSKWVGESESNARRMFDRASAMNNIVLYFDEINEQVEGGESEGHSVDRALRQYTLEWLDTHWLTDDVFVVMTANDISSMHMALTRPGRVDAIWYMGLPGKVQKQQIWPIAVAAYTLGEEQTAKLPDDRGWAGKEIEQCAKIADNFGVSLVEAARYIVPSSVREAEKIARLVDWADGRCLDAETGTLFRKNAALVYDEPTGEIQLGARPRRKIRKV